jgi:hypothetical protein
MRTLSGASNFRSPDTMSMLRFWRALVSLLDYVVALTLLVAVIENRQPCVSAISRPKPDAGPSGGLFL